MISPASKMVTLTTPMATLVKDWEAIAASGSYSEGRYGKLFEAEVEAWCGMSAASCNSAGTGLFILGRLFGGGACIVPNNTFVATATMMTEAGWDVIPADCAPDDFCLTPETILAAAKTLPVRAVVLTHVGGGLALRYREIAELCAQRGWLLIEDAAHVLGVSASGLTAGSLGHAAVFSLYPTKAVPVGEGGVIVSKDDSLVAEARTFRNYGKTVVDGVIKYGAGFNFRMAEWEAAIAYRQMQNLSLIMERRAACADQLMRVVAPLQDWEGHTN